MAPRYAYQQDGWALAKRGKQAKAIKIAETGDGVEIGTERALGVPFEPVTAAINAFKAWLTRFRRVNQGDNPAITELLDANLVRLEQEGHTFRTVAVRYKRLKKFFGALGAKDVSHELCQRYARDQEAAGYATGTIWGDLKQLRSALKASYGRKLLDTPVHDFVWVPSQPAGRDRVITPEEFWRWYDAATAAHIRLFLIIALLTAARHEAICQLKWEDVDFETGMIDFTASMRAKKSILDKGWQKSRARVAMSATLRAYLMAAHAESKTLRVIEYQGNPVDNCQAGCAAARIAAGLSADVVPHILRHTAATWATEMGVNTETVADMTGHKDKRVLEQIYTHKSGQSSRGAVEAVEQKLGKRLRVVK